MRTQYYILPFVILVGTWSIQDVVAEPSSTNNPALTGEPPPKPAKHRKKTKASTNEAPVLPKSPIVSTNTPPTGTNASSATTNASAYSTNAPVVSTNAPSSNAPATTAPSHVPDDRIASLDPADLREFAAQSPEVQDLITRGLALTRRNLVYKYGSADPKNGGMDCSGTVYYLLNQAGLEDVPRDSSEMYTWTWKKSHVEPVISSKSDTFELDRLKPGDLLFWSGTYRIERDPPVTHVMIYLGINRHNGHRVMIGASEGRTFEGKSRYGVSVFDFVVPGVRKAADTSEPQARFVGYGPIPGLENAYAKKLAKAAAESAQ